MPTYCCYRRITVYPESKNVNLISPGKLTYKHSKYTSEFSLMFDLLREAPSSRETSGTSEQQVRVKSRIASGCDGNKITELTMDAEAGRGRHQAVVEAGGRGWTTEARHRGLGPRSGCDLASGLTCLAPDLRWCVPRILREDIWTVSGTSRIKSFCVCNEAVFCCGPDTQFTLSVVTCYKMQTQ